MKQNKFEHKIEHSVEIAKKKIVRTTMNAITKYCLLISKQMVISLKLSDFVVEPVVRTYTYSN